MGRIEEPRRQHGHERKAAEERTQGRSEAGSGSVPVDSERADHEREDDSSSSAGAFSSAREVYSPYREHEGYRAHEDRYPARGGEASWSANDPRYSRDRAAASSAEHSGRTRRPFRGPKGYIRSDERIREDVCDALAQSDELDPSEIEVNVSGGEVSLSGSVPEPSMKWHAEQVVGSVLGVTEVDNQLRVKRVEWEGGAS